MQSTEQHENIKTRAVRVWLSPACMLSPSSNLACLLGIQHCSQAAAFELHHMHAGAPAATRSTPDAASALLAADYNSDEEGASIQGSAPTAAEARDGSHSANGLPQGFFEVKLARKCVDYA